MERRYRLQGRNRFQAIRGQGRRWVHSLVILGGLQNSLGITRCGFIVSGKMGKAVERNRIRRRMREAVRLRYCHITPGWDLVFVARAPLGRATFEETGRAIESLLRQAGLWQEC